MRRTLPRSLFLILAALTIPGVLAQPADTSEDNATISGTIYLPVDSTREATTLIATLAATAVSLYAANPDTTAFTPAGLTPNVWLTAPDSTGYSRVDVTWSSTAGVYTFSDVPAGRYRIEVTPPGRPRRVATLTITEARAYRLDFYPPGDLRQVGETMLAPIRQSN
ncbi:MAG: carboxypeptidase-like regulatory domain-containing protein [Bacteroidota bacterium]